MDAKNLISEWIFKKSFSRFRYKVLIRNETSHTQLTKTDMILIHEMKENGLTLEIPKNTCQKNHSLTLFFIKSDTEFKRKLPDTGTIKGALFEVIVKVENMEPNASNKNMVFAEITFTQYDVAQWKKLVESCLNHQEDINNMITSQHLKREE